MKHDLILNATYPSARRCIYTYKKLIDPPFWFEVRLLLLHGWSAIALMKFQLKRKRQCFGQKVRYQSSSHEWKDNLCVALIQMRLLELENSSNLKYTKDYLRSLMLLLRTLARMWNLAVSGLLNYENKEEHDCCHSCEDVRDTFRNKGWGVTNPDLIDQVRCW